MRTRWKIKIFWAWYDSWIGAYWNKDTKTLYICPFFWVVISIHKMKFPEDGPWNLKRSPEEMGYRTQKEISLERLKKFFKDYSFKP